MLSQNATFVGPANPDTEREHPAGLPVAREIGAVLARHGWTVGEPDDWRNCGWRLPCRKDEGDLEIVIAQASAGPTEWALQIAPARVPGWMGRLLGRLPSASPSDVYGLAVDVHAGLSRQFTRIRWRWDGFADEASSTARPVPPRT